MAYGKLDWAFEKKDGIMGVVPGKPRLFFFVWRNIGV
jgi:hypothetical protein